MRAHPEAVWYRLEPLLLVVNAVPAPPEPGLMHKRTVRRVHQSDNSVINMGRQVAAQVRDFVFLAEGRQRRRRRNCLRQPRTRCVHVHPNVAVSFLAGKMARENPLHFQLVLARQRWNLHAAPTACVEAPAVITAFDRGPVESAIRKWNAPVRAGIPHRKRLPLARAAQHKRNLEQHRLREFLASNFAAPQRWIPKVPQKSWIDFARRFAFFLRLCWRKRLGGFTHRNVRILVCPGIPEQCSRAVCPNSLSQSIPIKSGTLEEVDCSTALAGTRGEVFFLERFPCLLSFSGK